MKEISINDIENISIGQVEDSVGGTGVTVIVSRDGMKAGLDVRGGGPASRESQLLSPLADEKAIHAVVFSGGSAFGLGAANGVMECLEERDIGYDVRVTKVPLVCQSSIFDLGVGDPFRRPDVKMGYEAATLALDNPNYKDGNYGVGCAATVGKLYGIERCVKSGIGSYVVQIGNLKIGAIAVVNAFGDILDWKNGKIVAGMLNEDMKTFGNSSQHMAESKRIIKNKFTDNTTLTAIITNGHFDKAALCKIAGMGHNGYARSINPVHTSADGDTIYALSVGEIEADRDMVGTLAAEIVSEAILCAVRSAKSAFGIPAIENI